ncbi:hypothetical protein, partial [Methanoculleus sp. UBA374]|uniref:hypothetical protein n=1 Tax=Methanoculleus sp. UBA374 TaxID=1915505 RepID=UPI00319DC07C
MGEVEVTYLHFHAGTREKREAQRTLSGCGCGFEEFVEKVIPKHLRREGDAFRRTLFFSCTR